MQSINLTTNYFELFNLPVNFAIDKTILIERYRQLQHVVHPDKYANAGDHERRLSVQQSAYINEALQTLKDPLLRAKYLLMLKGYDLSNDTTTQMDPAFLMQQIELREEIAAVRSDYQALDKLIIVSDKIEQSISKIIEQLSNLLPSDIEDNLLQACDRVRRLQFMRRLQEEVILLEEELS